MREMRRKERAMTEEEARRVLDACEYAVLSMADPDGKPYAVPISPATVGNTVYFHCAPAGYKLECMEHEPDVCLVCAGGVVPIPEQFSTAYQSVVAFGRAEPVTDDTEKIHALRLICEKYAPSNMGGFDEAIRNSLARTGSAASKRSCGKKSNGKALPEGRASAFPGFTDCSYFCCLRFIFFV